MGKFSTLRRLRMYHGLTQQDMADLINVDKRTYINKEDGRSQFKQYEMYLISQRFDLSVDKIFFDENFMFHEVKAGEKECRP